MFQLMILTSITCPVNACDFFTVSMKLFHYNIVIFHYAEAELM